MPEAEFWDVRYEDLVPKRLLRVRSTEVIDGAESYMGLIYRAVPGWRPLRLDLHVPASEGPHPTVCFVHGGSFMAGVPELGAWYDLPSKGIAVASLSYRLSSEAGIADVLDDIRSGVQWLYANQTEFALDGEKVALWGNSAGAYLACLVALGEFAEGAGRPREERLMPRISAVVDYFGISDPSQLRADVADTDSTFHLALDRVVAPFLEGTVPLSLAEAVVQCRTKVCPFMIFHGEKDSVVGVDQSLRFHRALRDAGIEAQIHLVPAAGHGGPEFADAQVVNLVVQFLRSSWGLELPAGAAPTGDAGSDVRRNRRRNGRNS